MTPTPILYSFRRCPFAIRARLALDASMQHCEVREVVLRNKPLELLQVSAKGTVPVLVQPQGTVIEESLEIMLWTLRRNDPERWLTPHSGSLPEMLDLIDHFDTRFKAQLDRYKYPSRFSDTDPSDNRAQASENLGKLEQRLSANQFLFGGHAALADMAIMPFVRQFAGVSPDWFAAQPWVQLQAWLANLQQSARFLRIMRLLSPWTPGTLGVRFPFDERNRSTPRENDAR
jgi:glutathione S-transferase